MCPCLDPLSGHSGCVLVWIHCRSAALEGMGVDALVAELKASLEWGDGMLAVVKHVWKDWSFQIALERAA